MADSKAPGFRERVLSAASILMLGEDRTRRAPPRIITNDNAVPLLNPGQTRVPILPPVDLSEMPEAYQIIPIVYAAVYAIAHSFASVPLIVSRRTADGLVAIPDHPLLGLINPDYGIPNPQMSAYDLWEANASFLELAGNSYWQLEGPGVIVGGPPATITPMRPDRIRPICEADGTPLRYEYWLAGRQIVLDASEVMHFKFFNPMHPVFGQSSILASKTSILLDIWANAWNKDFFRNGATLGPVLSFPDEIATPTLTEMLRQFNQKFAGPGSHQHEAHALSGGAEIIFPPSTKTDMGFFEGLKYVDSRILMGMGVPPVMVTLLEGSHYQNTEAQITIFWNNCIIPKLRKSCATINRLLAPRYGADIVVSFDKSAITALRQALADIVKVVQSFVPAGVMTPNEARAYLATGDIPPLPDLEGGDVARVIPQAGAGPGNDPNAKNGLAPNRRLKSVDQVIADVEKAARARRVAENSAAGSAARGRREVRVASEAPLLSRFLNSHFNEQETALKAHVVGIVAGAAAAPGGLMACTVRNGKPDRFVNNLDLIDNLIREIRDGNKAKQRAVYQKLIGSFGQKALGDLAHVAADLTFNAVSHNALEFVAVHALNNLTNLDATTADMVKTKFRSALAESQLEGDNLQATAKRIMDTAITDSFQSRRDNANRIAQTETTGAYNFANHEAMLQSDVVATKVWHNQGDANVRGEQETDDFDHWDMEGVEVGINEPFMVPNRQGTPEPLMYPGDPAGSAGNVINCRCLSLPGQFKAAGNASPTAYAAAIIRRMAEPIFPKEGGDASR